MGSWSHSTWSATQVEKWKTTTTANESAKKQANDQRTRDRDGRTSCKRPLEACQARGQGQVGVPSICCSQGTARGIPPSCGPLSTFTASTRPALQDEQDQRRDRTSRARSLPGKDRLDKRVWSSTFEQPGSSLPGCKGGGQVMVASWNATRDKLCSLRIHMCHKDRVEGVEMTRDPNGQLPGRLHHSDASHDIPRSTTTAHNGDQNIHQARLQDQCTKNVSRTNQSGDLPRHGNQHHNMGNQVANGQKTSCPKKHPKTPQWSSDSKITREGRGGSEGSRPGMAHGPPGNVPPAEGSFTNGKTRVGHKDVPVRPNIQRTSQDSQTSEPRDHHPNHTRPRSSNIDNRCSPITRMGSNTPNRRQGLEILRTVDRKPTRQTLHRDGDESSRVRNDALPTSHSRHKTVGAVRLHSSCVGSHTETSQVRTIESNCHADPRHDSEVEYIVDKLAPCRSVKCSLRQAKSDRGPQWAGSQSRSVCTHTGSTGTMHNRCIRDSDERQAASLHIMATRPRSRSTRLLCTASQQERALLHLPANSSSLASIGQGPQRASTSSDRCPVLPRPSVGTTPQVGNIKIHQPRNRCTRAKPSIIRAAEKYTMESLPVGDAGTLARAALSKSTWQKYDNAFKQWVTYCITNHITVPTATAQDFEKFLIQKVQEVKTGVALREMRAGIIASGKLRQLDTTIYETNKVNQLIQGAMRTRPQLPTLPVTFDAADALRRIAQKSTPVEMETAKTMFLLMILGPWRLADVLAMRPSAIIPRGEAYYCALQTKGGRGEYEWRVVEPCDNKSICPVIRLRYLLSQPVIREKDCLWLDNKHNPLNNAQARDMVQRFMIHVGIGPEWSPHHCRAAGASMMVLAGVPYLIVARHGGWKIMENMLHFYVKTFANDDVSRTVEKYASRPQH